MDTNSSQIEKLYNIIFQAYVDVHVQLHKHVKYLAIIPWERVGYEIWDIQGEYKEKVINEVYTWTNAVHFGRINQ